MAGVRVSLGTLDIVMRVDGRPCLTWAYTLLAWDQFIRSDCVGRVPMAIEHKLARVPRTARVH